MLGIPQNQQVLVVLFLGSKRPIITSGQYKLIIQQRELVMHFGSGSLPTMNEPEGKLRALQKFLSGFTFFKSILVQDQADANVSLARIEEGPREALIIKSV